MAQLPVRWFLSLFAALVALVLVAAQPGPAHADTFLRVTKPTVTYTLSDTRSDVQATLQPDRLYATLGPRTTADGTVWYGVVDQDRAALGWVRSTDIELISTPSATWSPVGFPGQFQPFFPFPFVSVPFFPF